MHTSHCSFSVSYINYRRRNPRWNLLKNMQAARPSPLTSVGNRQRSPRTPLSGREVYTQHYTATPTQRNWSFGYSLCPYLQQCRLRHSVFLLWLELLLRISSHKELAKPRSIWRVCQVAIDRGQYVEAYLPLHAYMKKKSSEFSFLTSQGITLSRFQENHCAMFAWSWNF